MNDIENRKRYLQMADEFIDLANAKCETEDKALVASAFLYAAARFCSFVVAAEAGTLSRFEADREPASKYFNDEFQRMFGEHLDDYKKIYTQD